MQYGEHCDSMRVPKKELFVIVVKEQAVHCGLYHVMRGVPQLLVAHEQLFSDDIVHQAHIYNLPVFVDTIRPFLLLAKHHHRATILCLDDEQGNEMIQQTQKQPEEEIAAMKYGSLRLSSCCDALQRTYMWRCPYYLIVQYTLLLTLLHCRLISIRLPLQSLIYFNHRYGEKKHPLIFDGDNVVRSDFEKRSSALLRTMHDVTSLPHGANLLHLYSFASAYVGVNMR